MATTISYEDSSSGVLTSTTYVESTISDTLPERQVIPIMERVSVPDTQTDEQLTAVLTAFFGSTKAPELWIDCLGGEVVTVECFTGTDVHVDVTTTNAPTSLSYDVREFTPAYTIKYASSASDLLQAENHLQVGSPFAHVSANVRVFQTSQHRIAVNGNEPKRFVIPGNVKPYCIVNHSKTEGTYIFVKRWGYVYSDSFLEREVQDVNPTTRAITWKKVFQTAGKVIKVIAEVAKVVIPFALSFAAQEGQADCPAELEKLNRRMAQRSIRPTRSNAIKRKRSKDSGKSASKKAPASKKQKGQNKPTV